MQIENPFIITITLEYEPSTIVCPEPNQINRIAKVA